MLLAAKPASPRLAFTLLVIFVIAGLFTITAPTYADDMGDWRKALVKRIGSKMIYPKSAIRKGIQGKARVKVTIDRTGEITNFEITSPTGEAALDKVIDKSIKRMNPLPAPPASLPDTSLTFTIPLNWSL